MSKKSMVDAQMKPVKETDVRMVVEQLERIAMALERLVENQEKAPIRQKVQDQTEQQVAPAADPVGK
jgi:hypothetical protein